MDRMNHRCRAEDRHLNGMVSGALLLLLALALHCVVAQSAAAAEIDQQLVFEWSPPTQRQDGSELSADDLDHYTLYCAPQSAEQLSQVAQAPGEATQLTKAGSELFAEISMHECALSVTDSMGRESPMSESVAVDYRAPPMAPGDLNIAINIRIQQ